MGTRYDLDPVGRQDLKGHPYVNTRPGEVPIRISPEQAKALAHAATSPELICAGFASLAEVIADQDGHDVLNRTLVLDTYIVNDDGSCDLGVNYVWNEEGGGVWLAPDGGWHYQPNEKGYYPWREASDAG
jgi:hypothetical protein